jgi:hypothetical protein
MELSTHETRSMETFVHAVRIVDTRNTQHGDFCSCSKYLHKLRPAGRLPEDEDDKEVCFCDTNSSSHELFIPAYRTLHADGH